MPGQAKAPKPRFARPGIAQAGDVTRTPAHDAISRTLTRSRASPQVETWIGNRRAQNARDRVKALREKGNEIDLHALRGLIKAMGS